MSSNPDRPIPGTYKAGAIGGDALRKEADNVRPFEIAGARFGNGKIIELKEEEKPKMMPVVSEQCGNGR